MAFPGRPAHCFFFSLFPCAGGPLSFTAPSPPLEPHPVLLD